MACRLTASGRHHRFAIPGGTWRATENKVSLVISQRHHRGSAGAASNSYERALSVGQAVQRKPSHAVNADPAGD